MKKIGAYLIAITFLLFSTVTFGAYGDHVNDDGQIVIWDVGDDYNILQEIERNAQHLDNNDAKFSQQTEAIFTAKAYIPCYLRMEIMGNQGYAKLENFGPADPTAFDTWSDMLPWRWFIEFDNEVGGFVDEDWNSLGHGMKAEVAPGDGIYIQGCDQYRVKVYANDNFEYYVVSGPLTPVNAAVASSEADDDLDLHMRTSTDNGTSWNLVIFDEPEQEFVGSGQACESLEALHQFRVPYTTSTAHGQYKGTVTFLAYTI